VEVYQTVYTIRAGHLYNKCVLSLLLTEDRQTTIHTKDKGIRTRTRPYSRGQKYGLVIYGALLECVVGL